LNQLANVDMMFGILVHELIYESVKTLFRQGKKPDQEYLYQSLKKQLNHAYGVSVNQREQWRNVQVEV